jgi:hypothetical protein
MKYLNPKLPILPGWPMISQMMRVSGRLQVSAAAEKKGEKNEW